MASLELRMIARKASLLLYGTLMVRGAGPAYQSRGLVMSLSGWIHDEFSADFHFSLAIDNTGRCMLVNRTS